jgi:hypothetical protein
MIEEDIGVSKRERERDKKTILLVTYGIWKLIFQR